MPRRLAKPGATARFAETLDTSIDIIDAALTASIPPNSARKCIFDSAVEAKLNALACSPPPKRRKRCQLRDDGKNVQIGTPGSIPVTNRRISA